MIQRLFEAARHLTALAEQRSRMVEEQLCSRGIRDQHVLAVMAKVPREEFIGKEDLPHAYSDQPIPIGAGQTVSQPYMVATMLEALAVCPEDRVLEVGTGTGYQAAILGEMAAEVWTIERNDELAEKAEEILARLGYANVHVLQGDGSRGLPAEAPFNKILVAAAAPRVPQSLTHQLAEGGALVLPVGSRSQQQVQLVRKLDGEIVTTKRDLCRFVPLLGEEGWQP